MATPYTIVTTSFLNKISDAYLITMSDEELGIQLLKFLNSAVPKFKKCKKDLSLRDASGFSKDLTDEEIEILANLMVVEWLRPQVNHLELLKQALNSRDFHMFSQSQHLKELQALRKDARQEISKLLVDYSYNNNSLDDLDDD